MTQQILFIQGGGDKVHDAWDDKLVASLKRELGPGYDVRYPRMPHEDDPKYAEWKAAIGKELDTLGDGVIVVGHSIGGTMLVHALAEESAQAVRGTAEERDAPKRQLGAIVLVSAPFVGEGGWPSDEIAAKEDLGAQLPAGVPVLLFHGDQDETAPPAHANLYARAIPQAEVHMLPGRDHQLNEDLGEVAVAIKRWNASRAN